MANGPSLPALAWRNLWRNRRRTLITLVGIAFGLFLSILFTGLGDASYSDMINYGAKMGGGHVAVQHEEYLDSPSLKKTVPNAHLIAVAIVCLVATAGARLALPNFQGDILDNVFQGEEEEFWANVRLLAACSVVTGLFGAVRTAAISVVGRRIAWMVRNNLFSSIVVQPVPLPYLNATVDGDFRERRAKRRVVTRRRRRAAAGTSPTSTAP